jgi:uncharacterized membrane protein
MLSLQNTMLFFTMVFSGLVAGLLYSYSFSVNPGLKAVSDKEYLTAMQSINRAIQNPVFFITFIGLLILLPVCCLLAYKQQIIIPYKFILSATLIYFIGVFGITAFGNIPLNNQLDKFNISAAGPDELVNMRKQFETAWIKWHTIRTIASVISFAIMIAGFFRK